MPRYVLTTRPQADAARDIAWLEKNNITAISAPMLDIRPLDVSLPDADGFDAVVLTSRHAAHMLQGSALTDLPCYCVGRQQHGRLRPQALPISPPVPVMVPVWLRRLSSQTCIICSGHQPWIQGSILLPHLPPMAARLNGLLSIRRQRLIPSLTRCVMPLPEVKWPWCWHIPPCRRSFHPYDDRSRSW